MRDIKAGSHDSDIIKSPYDLVPHNSFYGVKTYTPCDLDDIIKVLHILLRSVQIASVCIAKCRKHCLA